MKIVISPHARQRMRERKITELIVQVAVLQPDRVASDKTFSGRFVAKKIVSRPHRQSPYLLLVVYELRPKVVRVITVISTSKITKYF